MTTAIQSWMKSDVGQEYVRKVVEMSKNGAERLPPSLEFPSVNIGEDIGYGFKVSPKGLIEPLGELTKVKVVLHPDGQGGFILKSAFPTI